jgi:DNA-binding transcriptional regulator YhcF (GntR family)
MSGKELFITISPSNPDPMYRQITDQIKDAIAAGDLNPADQLPSIREMAEMLKISAITIKRAYQDLETEGFIMTRAGLGSFIAEKNLDEIREEKLREIRERMGAILETGRRYGISFDRILQILHEEMK